MVSRPLSDPVGTRTQNRLLRRQMLYPVELRDHAPLSGAKMRKGKCIILVKIAFYVYRI